MTHRQTSILINVSCDMCATRMNPKTEETTNPAAEAAVARRSANAIAREDNVESRQRRNHGRSQDVVRHFRDRLVFGKAGSDAPPGRRPLYADFRTRFLLFRPLSLAWLERFGNAARRPRGDPL